MSMQVRAFGKRVVVGGGVLGMVMSAGAQNATPSLAQDRAQVMERYGKLPLRFEARGLPKGNGQTDGDMTFVTHGAGYGLSLTGREAVLALHTREAGKTDVVRVQVEGASGAARPVGEDRLPGVVNYMMGNDAAKWATGIPTYARVRYAGVYPGIDLVYYGNQQQLEYDFVVKPRASAGAIRLHFGGATKVRLDADGNLRIAAEDGSIAFHKPVVYQTVDGEKREVEGKFRVLAGNSVGFEVGAYDRTRELVIDPTLIYSTYLGGSTGESVAGIAADSTGAVYVTGSTVSTDFPVTAGSYKATDPDGRSAVFVTKLNSSGSALLYSTYLGGSGSPTGGDFGQAIAIDSSGDAYVTGYTYSTDFPTTAGVYQKTNKAMASGGGNGFVAKLNPAGSALLYSTYVGGSGNDQASSVAVDSSGDAYIAGVTFSTDFPTTAGVLQTTNLSVPTGDGTAFVTKVNPTATALLYSTYLGGSADYEAFGPVLVAVNSAGDAYVAGSVDSTDFPVTAGAYQTTNKGTAGGGFNLTLSELNPTATKLVYSTYIGGSGAGYRGDVANGLAIDSAGNAYIAGSTYEANYPVTSGAFQKTNNDIPNDRPDSFITKMNPTGTALVYSTFLGGSGGGRGDEIHGLAVDSSGDVYVTGSTGSSDFPVTSNAYQTSNAAADNSSSVVFLTELNPAGSALLYSTFFGGRYSSDVGNGVALGASGAVYFAGYTTAKDFPITPNAYEQTFHSANYQTGFVAEITLGTAPTTAATAATLTARPNPAASGQNVTFTASIQAAKGTSIPNGNVVFTIDQGTGVSVALNAQGFAAYTTTTPLSLGNHAILASYAGNATWSASAASLTEGVVPLSPVIAPAGGLYTSAQVVTISDATPGTVLYYTLDGSVPTTSSTKYTAPFVVSTATYVSVIAVVSGQPNSYVATANYTFVNAPTVLAVSATGISAANATLNALIDLNALSGSYSFAYGTSSTALTSSTATVNVATSVLNRLALAPVPVSAVVTGLKTKTTYYYQVMVTTKAGTAAGKVLSFTTN